MSVTLLSNYGNITRPLKMYGGGGVTQDAEMFWIRRETRHCPKAAKGRRRRRRRRILTHFSVVKRSFGRSLLGALPAAAAGPSRPPPPPQRDLSFMASTERFAVEEWPITAKRTINVVFTAAMRYGRIFLLQLQVCCLCLLQSQAEHSSSSFPLSIFSENSAVGSDTTSGRIYVPFSL